MRTLFLGHQPVERIGQHLEVMDVSERLLEPPQILLDDVGPPQLCLRGDFDRVSELLNSDSGAMGAVGHVNGRCPRAAVTAASLLVPIRVQT